MRSTLRRKLRRWRRHGPGMLRPGIALLIAIGAPASAASAAPSASAAPAKPAASWDPPRELSNSDSAPLNLAATAGIAPTGDAVVLWHGQKGVQAAVRASGHNFGTPRSIAGSTLSIPYLRPQLAFDAKGAALAVWSYFEPHPR